jgi:hypothetical protein
MRTLLAAIVLVGLLAPAMPVAADTGPLPPPGMVRVIYNGMGLPMMVPDMPGYAYARMPDGSVGVSLLQGAPHRQTPAVDSQVYYCRAADGSFAVCHPPR